MAKYVDGYVLVVPKGKLAAYKKVATEAGKLWRKFGALDYKECAADDVYPDMGMPMLRFPDMVKAKKGETVVFAYVLYRSRAHRDAVNKKVRKVMEASYDEHKASSMPFDMKRMAFGGFTVIVDA